MEGSKHPTCTASSRAACSTDHSSPPAPLRPVLPATVSDSVSPSDDVSSSWRADS